MKFKVTVEVGRKFEFDDIESKSESDAKIEAENRAQDLISRGEINFLQVDVEERD